MPPRPPRESLCRGERHRWWKGGITPFRLQVRHLFQYRQWISDVFHRDNFTCQYCGRKLTASQITIDHVLPRAQKGITSFTNCVVCCQICNNKKADRTPEQAAMVLLKRPAHPSFSAHHYVADPQEHWHPSWDDFLGNS